MLQVNTFWCRINGKEHYPGVQAFLRLPTRLIDTTLQIQHNSVNVWAKSTTDRWLQGLKTAVVPASLRNEPESQVVVVKQVFSHSTESDRRQ